MFCCRGGCREGGEWHCFSPWQSVLDVCRFEWRTPVSAAHKFGTKNADRRELSVIASALILPEAYKFLNTSIDHR